MHILLVEDDERLARMITRILAEERHLVEHASDGEYGLALAEAQQYDVLVLDVMLPGIDGVEVCRRLRGARRLTPILLLTARDSVGDRVRGLDAGADDYLVKPFAMEELLARVRALGRRQPALNGTAELTAGDLVLSLATRDVRRGDRELTLTAREFSLLEYLLRHQGRVLNRDQILAHVWGYEADTSPKQVDLYVHYLRDKLSAEGERQLIHTIRGIGYTLRP